MSNIPAALEEIANGRDHIRTEEFAKFISRACHTIRVRYCENGNYYGVKPVKIGNRLLWPVADVAKLMNGGAQ